MLFLEVRPREPERPRDKVGMAVGVKVTERRSLAKKPVVKLLPLERPDHGGRFSCGAG